MGRRVDHPIVRRDAVEVVLGQVARHVAELRDGPILGPILRARSARSAGLKPSPFI